MRRLHVPLIAAVIAAVAAAIALAQGSEETALGPTTIQVTREPLIVQDPEGPPHYVLRTYRQDDGDLCLRYGRQGKDRLLPPHNIECQQPAGAHSPVQVSISASAGTGSPRTIISGLVDPSVRRLTVAGPGAARTFEFRGGRAFMAVYEGYVAPSDLPLTATLAGGEKTRVLWGGGETRAYAPDPDHGPPWYVSGGRLRTPAQPRPLCAQVGRDPTRFGGGFMGTAPGRPICGRLDLHPYYFALRAWDVKGVAGPGAERKRVTEPTHWILFGAANNQVQRIEVKAGSDVRMLERSRSTGGFIGVFRSDGLARRDIRVTFTLADGRKAQHIGPTLVHPAPRPDLHQPQPRKARAERGTCQLRDSRTLLRTPRGRVYVVSSGERAIYHACPFNRPEHYRLQDGGVFWLPALARPYVAWVSARGIERVELGPRGRFGRPVKIGGLPPRSVKALVVTVDGWVAWIQERGRGTHEVWRFDSRGASRLDRGDVNPRSLCRLGSRIFWAHGNEKPRHHPCELQGERTAFLR